MIEGRPDWCVSRQRVWGVPLPIFINKKTKEPLKDKKVIDRIAEKAVSYALSKTSGVAALRDGSNQIECIDFIEIKGNKPFDFNQSWFSDMLIEIGQKKR